MLRLRIYRVLIPAMLVIFIVVLAVQLRPVGLKGDHVSESGLVVGSSATGISVVDMDGDRKTIEIHADTFQELEDGRIRLEGIEELKLFRDGRPPLRLSALAGDLEGESGSRRLLLDEGVVLEDPEKRLTIRIPNLSVDEAKGEARSKGEVLLEGSGLSGTAKSLLYRLDGEPAEVEDLDLQDENGARLRSTRAVLHDGTDDIELIDDVKVERGAEFLNTDHLRMRRRGNKTLERVTAEGSVRGAVQVSPIEMWDLSSESLDLRFDGSGEPRTLELEGGAYLSRETDSLSAETIRARHVVGEIPGWRLACEGGVVLEGTFGGETAILRSSKLNALYDLEHGLVYARALGRVSFDGRDTRGEATRASYEFGVVGEIRLFGTERRKARMARERVRIAAEEIAFAVDGTQMFAERGVESSLLPPTDSDQDGPIGPFSSSESIHFVSATLSGRQSSSVLVFEGDVRGWQGERNLAAQRVTVDQINGTLRAEEDVSVRTPRAAGKSTVRQSDYIQITSGELDYSETDSEGVFRGAVRLQVAEGWMESEEVRVRMDEDGGGIVEVLAVGDIRLEFRRESDEGGPPQVMTGRADRLVYSPEDNTIWLIGEKAPASVQQAGEAQGTTTGRVLRYQLDLGTLEVDSGGSGPATIRTTG